ncbi:uncharacterized protein G2W53_038555 [Senna tora]|uniref:Uncharacterized protein n=1 Tax=Senna tora TaxID=362788 RepID=A0A834SLW0_9FABA|nr:uncharacterized protein G2W53_038555 [Senna tora]
MEEEEGVLIFILQEMRGHDNQSQPLILHQLDAFSPLRPLQDMLKSRLLSRGTVT